ncbi:diguanylate cyclase [Vibrio tapetis subsp. quintayensis]|uniref:diguanylate cyclase n=1 Tax=Vibrio tapetis TaxID=52443 RepID=UPI0025B6223C|nr:diguanylate cyclase [Vibrio tapetis]MDN3681378.1 diguanylate cyclase [Vibrio tapetis subsp. quintayensis]
MLNRILVVEDSRAFRNYLESQLTSIGFDVVLAASCSDAKIILDNDTNFMCAVLDYCLPDGEDGEIIDLVLSYKLRVIILTAMFSDAVRERVIAKGVLDYITKDSTASVSYLRPLLKRLLANHSHKALVVDDSAMVRNHVTYLLEHQFIETIQAKDGELGLQALKDNPDITLVITDHDMPNKDGITLTREIRHDFDRNHVAILGLSANSDRTLTARFLKAGANDFLYKPFNQEEFYCRVQHILDMKDVTDELYRMANQDSLTGLWNRRYLFEECSRIRDGNRNVAMIDIDFFKKVNDNYGHECGDLVLAKVAKLLQKNFKDDMAIRFGGEEFCVVSRSSYIDFITRLENTRKDIEQYEMSFDGQDIRVTVSIGVTSGASEVDLNEHLREADELLYKAKDDGRNRLIAKTS